MYRKLSLAVLAACIGGSASAHKAALDAGLFTTYSAATDGTSISYVVCGSLPQSEGCYGSGTLSPFEQACAVLAGSPKTKGNVITRAIYVLDKRKSKSAPITLNVFTRTDTITDSFDTVQVTLDKQVSLGVNGGAKSHCSLAGNDSFVYAATDADTVAVAIDKASFATSTLGGFSPPEVVKSITSDDRGYVAVHFDDGFYLYGPTGALQEDGGGGADVINTRNGWKPN